MPQPGTFLGIRYKYISRSNFLHFPIERRLPHVLVQAIFGPDIAFVPTLIYQPHLVLLASMSFIRAAYRLCIQRSKLLNHTAVVSRRTRFGSIGAPTEGTAIASGRNSHDGRNRALSPWMRLNNMIKLSLRPVTQHSKLVY